MQRPLFPPNIFKVGGGKSISDLPPLDYRFTQTIRLPHSSMESNTVARSHGLKGFTTHTGGAAGTPGEPQGEPQGGIGGRGQCLGGLCTSQCDFGG